MRFRQLHPWNLSTKQARRVQSELRHLVSLVDGFDRITRVAGVDVSVPAGTRDGYAAVAVLSFPEFELVEVQRAMRPLSFSYIPGYLSFREIPVVLDAFDGIQAVPDLIIVDGQGIAHPRGLGIAAHLGLLLDAPTIGCAKSRLYGKHDTLGDERGSFVPLLDRAGRRIGDVVRTRSGVSPVYVSPGHKVSFDSAVDIILTCSPRYRLPEPIRTAHRLAGMSRDE